MQADANSGTINEHTAHSLRIIVPKDRVDLCRSLEHTFGQHSKVQVILDRRLADRRIQSDNREPERRRGDRRRRAEMEAELRAGRWWVTVPTTSWSVDFQDPDVRAILFLCCSEHVVPCQTCQNTYRLRSISRGQETGVFPCPLCGRDLTPTVVAHVQSCRYWDRRVNGAPGATGPGTMAGEAAAG